MEQQAFALLQSLEKSWWYRGRAAVITDAIQHIPIRPRELLDFGAGHGGMYPYLAPWGEVYAFEPEEAAKKNALQKPYRAIYQKESDSLAKKYDVIGLFDVLEHIEDDAGFLLRANKALTDAGRLVITVPAMPFLWSERDVEHHHFRRYTKGALRRVLKDTGYTVEYINYWNVLLFIPACLMRPFGKSGDESFALPKWQDDLFYSLIRFEIALGRFVPLPFGISLIAVAKKA